MSETLVRGMKPTDGRARRHATTRAALIDAWLLIARELGGEPTVARVAEIAGCNSRTVLQHFETLQHLAQAAIGHELERETQALMDRAFSRGEARDRVLWSANLKIDQLRSDANHLVLEDRTQKLLHAERLMRQVREWHGVIDQEDQP